MESLGQWLREEREARGVSLEEVASATKVVPRYLEALENDRLDMMPGGFFIKGIIRTYAQAVGLDPDEVLGRYRSAGLLSAGPEHGRKTADSPAEKALPQVGPAPTAIGPEAPKEPIVRSEAAPARVEKAGPPLLIEEASKPEDPSAARKRLLAWAWRGLAVAVIGGATFFVLRPILSRPRPARSQASTVVGESALPPAQVIEPARTPQPPPVEEEDWNGITIEIDFQADTWIQVYTDGDLKINGIFPPGATALAQAEKKVLIHTGNAGGFTFRLNGRPARSLGRSGQVLSDIKITPENLKDFLEGPSSGRTAG